MVKRHCALAGIESGHTHGNESHGQRQTDRHRRCIARQRRAALDAAEAVTAVEDHAAGVPSTGESLVIAEMRMNLQTLTVGEAVMHLDVGRMPALMFRNRANGLFNIVYCRADGNFGWLDPQNTVPARTSS
jgi:hypothetical protein